MNQDNKQQQQPNKIELETTKKGAHKLQQQRQNKADKWEIDMGFEPGSTNISVRGRTDGQTYKQTDRWKERRMSYRVEGRLLFVADVVVQGH